MWRVGPRAAGAWRALLALALILALQSAEAAPEVHRFYGYALAEGDGSFLFTEVHQHLYDGERWLSGRIRYFSADNHMIGEKTLDFSQDPYLPVYRLTLPHDNYEEGLTAVTASTVEIEKTVDGSVERDRLERTPGMVADSGLHRFIVDHLGELQAGKIVPFVFVVPSRLTTYRFRLRKSGEASTSERHPLIQITGEPDSVLRLVAPSLTLVYDLTTRYLVEYHGVSRIHNPLTGRPYGAVKIVFPAKPPPGAPAPLPPLEGG